MEIKDNNKRFEEIRNGELKIKLEALQMFTNQTFKKCRQTFIDKKNNEKIHSKRYVAITIK